MALMHISCETANFVLDLIHKSRELFVDLSLKDVCQLSPVYEHFNAL